MTDRLWPCSTLFYPNWYKSCTTKVGWLKPYEEWDLYHRFQLVIWISQPSTVVRNQSTGAFSAHALSIRTKTSASPSAAPICSEASPARSLPKRNGLGGAGRGTLADLGVVAPKKWSSSGKMMILRNQEFGFENLYTWIFASKSWDLKPRKCGFKEQNGGINH